MTRYEEEQVCGRVSGTKKKKLLEATLKKQREATRQLKGYEEPREDHPYRGDAYSPSDY